MHYANAQVDKVEEQLMAAGNLLGHGLGFTGYRV